MTYCLRIGVFIYDNDFEMFPDNQSDIILIIYFLLYMFIISNGNLTYTRLIPRVITNNRRAGNLARANQSDLTAAC